MDEGGRSVAGVVGKRRGGEDLLACSWSRGGNVGVGEGKMRREVGDASGNAVVGKPELADPSFR